MNILSFYKTKNSLLTNSLNLIVSAGITAFFGYVFWIIVARSFKSPDIGLATTLLSMSSLLSLLGLAGFDTTLVRYLPKTKYKNEHINTGLIISGLASLLISGVFCLAIPLLSSKLLFVDHNLFYVMVFMVVTIFSTWNTLTNAILIAYRRASYVVLINIIFSVVKIALPLLVQSRGAMMIFIFAGIAQIVNVVISIIILSKHFGYRPSLTINSKIIKEIKGYGLIVYVANVFNLIPDSALPLVVINKLGPTAAAYFYIAFTTANLLYTIAFSTSQALLAEVSTTQINIKKYIKNALSISTAMLLPATIVLVVLCPLILSLFGHTYREGTTSILRILSLSSLLVMLYSVFNMVFKFTKNYIALLATTIINALVILSLSGILSKPYGLNGIGWAWFLGTLTAVIVSLTFYIRTTRKSLA